MWQVTSLCKQYGPIPFLQGISFSIGGRETMGLLGRNGAGKSTLTRILSGHLAPTSGEVSLWGHSMLENPTGAKRCVGYPPELPPLYGDMTVREHLQFVCALRGIPARKERVECQRVCGELSSLIFDLPM